MANQVAGFDLRTILFQGRMFMEEYASYSQRARLLSKRALLFFGQRLTLTLSTRPQLASTRSRRGTAAPPPSTSPRRCGAHRPPCRGTVVFAQCYTAKDVPRCWSVLRAPCERGRARALNARLARAAGRGRRRRLQHAEPAEDRQDWQRGGYSLSLSRFSLYLCSSRRESLGNRLTHRSLTPRPQQPR